MTRQEVTEGGFSSDPKQNWAEQKNLSVFQLCLVTLEASCFLSDILFCALRTEQNVFESAGSDPSFAALLLLLLLLLRWKTDVFMLLNVTQ